MRILLFADIHIGAIKDIAYVYNVVTDIIEKEVVLKKTDMVVILGDYFNRLFKVNEEYVALAVNIMTYLIRSCKRSGTKIRCIYGTESHEMTQYHLFNYHLTSTSVDMKEITTVTEEEIDGKKILYIPEEYMLSKRDFYKNTLYSGKQYDYIFGHGNIVDGMPSNMKFESSSKSHEKQVPLFRSGEFSEISKVCVFGHYHCYTEMPGNVYYLGSLFRSAFNEEIPKGYGIIEDDQFTFIENTQAYIYKTYTFDEESPVFQSADNLIREIQIIKDENAEIFSGSRVGKIRMVFLPPATVDPTFKDNLRNLLFNDKLIVPILKETTADIIEDAKEEVDDEFDFILDNSLNITEKIHTYITKVYDTQMSLSELTRYINEPLKI